MSERHLILVKLPYDVQLETSEGEKVYTKGNIVPIYHPWLFGKTAVYNLLQFMLFVKNDRKKVAPIFKSSTCEDDALVAIQALCSVNVSRGSCCETILEGKDIAEKPQGEDNDDGYTIIDLSGKTPKYAFFFYNDMEGAAPTLIPLSAEQYIRCFYNEEYYKGRKDSEKVKLEKEIYKLIKASEKYELISLDEFREMFPKMILVD